ncbi:MAG: hypothetical protein KGI51_04100 [Rhodospirillales bacterium]|nr:hypothetical protein [Rhodospirillales bacterium]
MPFPPTRSANGTTARNRQSGTGSETVGKAIDDWTSSKAKAMKIIARLDKRHGHLPKEPAHFTKAMEECDTHLAAIQKIRDQLEDLCTKAEDAASSIGNAADTYTTVVSRTDFGIEGGDPTTVGPSKEEARGILTSALTDIGKSAARIQKGLSSFIKELADFEKDINAAT